MNFEKKESNIIQNQIKKDDVINNQNNVQNNEQNNQINNEQKK